MVLLSSGMGNYRAPNSPAATLWHRDGGPYMRLTIYLDDVTEGVGPTAVVPGSHKDPNRPPPWANHDGQPRALPGMVPLPAPAGTCLINDTNIWHTAMPNRTSRPRRLVWVVYKWSTQVYDVRPEWHHSPEFVARQTDPMRRVLLGCTD